MDLLLVFSFAAGQLIKFPIGNYGGINLLDFTFGLICILGLVKNKFSLNKSPAIYKLGLVFIFISIISLLLSPLQLSFNEKLISFSYTLRFLAYLFASFLIYYNFLQLKKNINKILLLSGIILSILGILQIIFIPDINFLTPQGWDPHIYRIVSTFLDPNFMGAFFVLTLILLLTNPIKIPLNWQIIFFSITFSALLFTFSRGSYLMFFVSFLSITFFKKSLKTLILTLFLSLILTGGFLLYQQVIALPKGVDRGQSAESRLGTWQQGWEIFRKNPILGVGFNSYRPALRNYNLADEQQISSHGGSTNDSSLLFVAATSGILGLGAFLTFLFAILKASWRNWQNHNIWGLVVLSGLTGLIAQSFFANTLFYPPLLGWLMLSLSKLDNNS